MRASPTRLKLTGKWVIVKLFVRHYTSLLEGGVSVLQFHYLVATSQGIERFTERHELRLFSHEDYLAAYRESGLSVRYDPEGPIGRGLYVGLRPLT